MTFEKTFYQDLQKPLLIRHCDGIVLNNDNLSNTISVVITNNGEAATVSGSVVGAAIRADGATVAIEARKMKTRYPSLSRPRRCQWSALWFLPSKSWMMT